MNQYPSPPLQIGYVVSMSHGLQSFVYREVRELFALGIVVHLFPTKVGPGPYAPDSGWPVHKLSLPALVRAHFQTLLANSGRYLAVLGEALFLGGLMDFALAVLVARTSQEKDLRLIHCHFGDHKLFIGYFCAKLTGRPTSVTIHAYELYRNPNPRLFRRVLKGICTIVTISEYNRLVLARVWGVDPRNVRVIPLYTTLPPEPVLAENPPGEIVILTVARFVEKKGHSTLLRALAKLPLNYQLWLVGTGRVNVKRYADALHIASRVHFLGQIRDTDLHEVYRQATIFCLPSETAPNGDREGIPVAIMEAMAHGLPVVATRHAGIPELVSETLVDERDAESLAFALLRLGNDSQLRQRQGEKNRLIVSERFSPKNATLLKSLFEEMVHEST